MISESYPNVSNNPKPAYIDDVSTAGGYSPLHVTVVTLSNARCKQTDLPTDTSSQYNQI